MQKKPAQEDIRKLISIIQQQRWYTSNECLCDSDGDIVDYPQEDYMPHLPSWR
ncbi:unnamed protein product [Lepidochelys olivacea]